MSNDFVGLTASPTSAVEVAEDELFDGSEVALTAMCEKCSGDDSCSGTQNLDNVGCGSW